MPDISECVQTLHSALSSQDTSEIFKAEQKINEIDQLCSRRLTKQQLRFYCSLLLQSNNSLLSILCKYPQLKSVRELILKFLSSFIPRIGKFVLPYIGDVRRTCIRVFRRDKYSKCKDMALQIICHVLSLENVNDNEHWVDELRDMLFEEVAKTSSTTSTVRGHSLHALGIISRYYSPHMTNHANRLFNMYLQVLKKEMISSRNNGDLKIIEGSLNGLHFLMFSYGARYEENPERCSEILKFVRMAIEPQSQLSRFGVPLAGMELLQDHTPQFGDLLVKDYEAYYNSLHKWFQHNNPKLKHAAHLAIGAFLHRVATSISKDTSPATSRDIFMFFVKKFEKMIKTDSLDSKSMSLAVQGYGLLAGPCKRHLTKSDVSFMFSQLICRCDQIFLRNSDDVTSSEIHQLPNFVSALANIARQLEQGKSEESSGDFKSGLPENFMKSMQRLCVLLIDKYPKLHKKFSRSCCDALRSSVYAFSEKPEAMQRFQASIVYQGIIRTCSHDVAFSEDKNSFIEAASILALNDDETGISSDILRDGRTVTYKDYIALWESLIESSTETGIHFRSSPGLTTEQSRCLSKSFLASFLDSVIKISEKLNLAKREYGDTANSVESGDELVVENIADFKIFLNLCDLCCEIFPLIAKKGSTFSLHIHQLVHSFVTQSTRNPHITGYYKLLSSVMLISDKINYFSPPCSSGSSDMDVMDYHDALSPDVTQCLVFIQRFALEISSFVKQFKEDHLTACLLFILSLPLQVAAGILLDLTPTVQIACRIGISRYPVAEAVLAALSRWEVCESDTKDMLKKIIPFLEPFLHSTKEYVTEDVAVTKRKYYKKKSIEEADEPLRKELRFQVIKLFGKLGGKPFEWIERSKTCGEGAEYGVSPWDKDVSVEYLLPFRDMKPTIRLDGLLAQVLTVVDQASDRRKKISICELLHSITLYVIGRSSLTEHLSKSSYQLDSLYKKLFPVLFKLACDADEVCRQLFDPLVKQIIHWFTNNKQFESPNTAALLDCIMDGLVNEENNSSLRDLCAQSLCEFLKWSIKQNKSSDGNVKNAKSIFKRIYSLALHPSAVKRLGASTGFNHLYRVLREEDGLVNDYVFELLVTFVNCAGLSHYDDLSAGTTKSCAEVLNHLERIIKVKYQSLTVTSATRRRPRGFGDSTSVTLDSVVSWLFEQIGRPETECRHKCMKLFHQFTTLLQIHKKSPAVWIQKKINEKSLFYIISKFEGGGNDLGIATYTKLEDMPNQFSVKTALKWFDFVLAALDSYFYVFQEKLITPATIWKDKSSTKLFESLKYFTRNIARVDMHQAAQSISNNDCTFTPREINSYNNLKSTVSTRILQFVKILVKLNKENSFINELIPSDMWKEDTIFGLLSAAIVSPSSLGFHTDEDFTVAKQISDLSSQLLQSLSENFSPNRASNDTFLKDLFSILRKQLLKHGSLKDLLPQPFGSADMSNNVVNLHDLLRAYSVLINRRVLGDVLAGEGEDFEGCVEFGKKIFQLVYRSVVTNESSNNQDGVLFHHLSPSDVALGKSLLELAFVSGIPAECLVHSLFTSSNKILVGETKSNDVHVSLFLSLFSDEIYSHLCASASIYVPLICGNASDHPFMCCLILSGMLEHLAVNRIARKKYASCVCRLILREWDGSLTCLWSFSQMHLHQDTLNDIIVILMKMFALDSSVCKDSSNPKFNVVFDLYVEILKEESLPLSFKTKALDLLSFFTLSTAHAPKLKEALETMIVHHLPLSSKELTSGTNSFNDYVSTIRKLLNCVQDSGNLMVLEILINVFCREDDHILSEEVQSAFENAASRIPLEKQKQALSIPYKFYADLNRYSFAFRHRCVTKVLVVMAARCDVTAVIEFFACNVVEITTFIKEENVKWPESKLAEQLCMKTLAYSLMELMFVILPSQQIVPSSSIGYAYSNAADPSQSKDSLLKTFMKCANRDRNQNTQQATMLVEEQRRFQCSVYNAMIAAVICTQADQPWYKAFLFDENIKKNQYFLDNVIDMSREYEFDTEATEPLKQRKRFVAIRSQMHKKQDNEENDVSYMASVFESSLCEDVTVFDGNAGRLVSHSSKLGAAESSAMDVDEPKSDSCFGNFLNLEGDQLNQHECMATMVALIKHMHQNNIGLPPEDEDCDKLPAWMNAIHKKLSSTSSHKNVRLFITKLIINCEECFRQFASFWIAPLVQTYIRGDLGENGINSMVCDVMATVLSWNSVAIPEDTVEGRHLVQAVVEKLSKSVKSASRDVIRHNLYVLKTTLECWGKRIVAGIDPSIVYSLCDSSDLQSKENYSGLQLLGAMLVNDVAPYLPSYAVGRTAYFSRIFRNLLNKRKEIYDSTSEVAGMTLRHLTHVERDADGEIHSMVVEKLNDILVRSKEQDKFITCFHKVVLRYPEIVDKFLSKIFFIIPKLHGELRVKAFEILLQRGPKIPDLYRELKSKNLVSMLAVGDASLQLVSLRLSHCMLQLAIDTKDPKQFDDAVSYILPSIVEHFLSHVIPSCREEAFSIVMDVYDFLKTQSAEQRNDTALSTSRVFLFKALSDPEEALRNQVVNFWNDEQAGRLPVEAFSKLQVIFCDLYDPSLNEVEFLSNTIGLLLQCTSLSPDFERPVFDHPLSDCTFLEYAINTDWRHRHAGSSLRFIDTLQTAERSSLDETSAPRQSKSNVVAATQENQLFSATIAGNTRNTYNWMTGNSLDTFSSFSDVEAPERKSSLFANSSSSRRHITERLAGSTLQKDAHFGQKLLSYEVKGEAKKASGIEIDVQRLRKRFTKEAKDSPYKYARVQEQKRKKREQANKDRHSKLENQVQLYRKYRTGELPDIQIPNKSIIVPLAAACQHDATLSQYLMSSLILSFVKEEMKREELSGDEEQQNSKIVKISEDLAEILRASEEKCPSLIGCIEDVIFRDEDKIKKIDPSDVTSASIAANTQSLGIAVLEQYLLNSKHTVDIQAKRRKLTERSTNDDIDIWVALSRLYKSLGEFDVLHGIFSERGGFNSKTAEGLSMEVNGNYKTAYKIYQKALQENWDGSEVTEVEKDLWEDGLMNSLKNLSRWDQVNKLCNEHLSAFLEDSSQTHNLRLENSWKFPEFQDKYLDTSLHAKLMMLLQGNADAGNELASFIDDALKMGGETQKKVEKRFAEYLVILYIFQREYDRANYYLQVAIENFATNWSLLNVVMKEKQEEMLRILPRFTDIQDFLDVICKADGDYTFDCVSNLVMKWTNHDIYSRHDSASAWHDLILYRCFFVDRLKSRFEQVHSNDPALTSRVNKSKITMQLQIIESASLSNNFAVAKTTINRLEEVYDVIESDNELCVKLAHHTASMYHSQVNYQKVMSRDNPTCSINFLLAAYESLNAQSNVIGQLGSKSIAAVNHLVLLAKTYDLVCQNSSNLTDDVRDDVTNMVSSAQDSSNIQNALQSQAFLFYQKAAERASELIDSSDEVMSMQYKAYMALTEFCDERLRFHGEATSQSSTHNNEVITYAVTMTRCILKSMCIDGGGRAIAFLKFPRILQLTEKFESVRRVFIKETAALPVWMFLAWIGHMIALLDGETASIVQPIIHRMADEYPQAVVYPFMTALKDLKLNCSQQFKNHKSFVKRLKHKLQQDVPLADEFIKQLQFVSDPLTVFKDWRSEFQNLLEDRKKNKVTTNDVMESYQNMYNDFFDCVNTSQTEESSLYDSPCSQKFGGALWSKFANAYKKDVDELFGGSIGNKLPSMPAVQAKKYTDKLFEKMKTFNETARTLKDCSLWLADFQTMRRGGSLEIPGQYDGRSRPLLEYHVDIVGFDDRVVVMKSKQKPCRITICGSDEKNYQFLVKGGEDLRQDQRIESIFRSINDILSGDLQSRKKKLSIITYQVVPVSSKIGMIEWVKHTLPYWDFLSKQAERMDCKPMMDRLQKTDWIPTAIKKKAKNVVELYGELMKEVSYTEVINKFNEISKKLPDDILRKGYLYLSANPESFLTLRKQFVTSYAVMCVTHWLLGIGDRHTSNFLISMKSGHTVGIDFGHAFGSGTEVLPVPELVPFRLTPQIVGLLSPHSEKRGELRQVMIRCLSALRLHSDAILAILDVFIKDPSVDWTRFAKKSRQMDSSSYECGDVSDRTWYAQRKVKIVARKLGGENPGSVTCDEVEHNANVRSYCRSYQGVARGAEGRNIRARSEEDNLSVDAQVDCLIDQAADPNILGRMYSGWKSWL